MADLAGKTALSAVSLGLASALALSAAGAQTASAPVKIGVLTDIAGPFADIGGHGSIAAAEMAAADFGGSVLGRPIRILSADPQLKPDAAVTIARQWYDQEGVGLIVDLPNSPIALAVQALATEKKKLAIASSAATDALTNQQCSPYGAHWAYDSYSVGKTLAAALGAPDSSWFFLTADNSGGTALQESLSTFLKKSGAAIRGTVRFPPHAGSEMSSFILQAQASGAKFIPVAGAGGDLLNVVKQAREFDLGRNGHTIVGTAIFVTDVKAMGLEAAEGLSFATGWVDNQSPEATAWSKRFFERRKAMPNAVQAGIYSAVLHYLKAMQATGTDDAAKVMAKMQELPVNDMFATNGVLRKDGRMVHDMYLVQAKKPSESTGPWDLVKIVKTVPGADAFRPVSESACPLLKSAQ
ncbi:ABC transporter substrate-binding protein [Bosea sp. MMO-172]|uniref:ABC transporter substrate-binding protein n=1 Tax=Bosea sp. MMO-172 TaxID=3127885 RepID=UPI0030175EF8